MTIKLGNLADWRVLDGKSLAFTAPDYDAGKARKVRLDLNSEFGCNWYIKAGEDERFLAVVPAGLQTLEFVFDGNFEVMPVRPDDCEIHYWTSEAEEYWTEGDGETFSTIYERQERNEAMEWVMFQAAQNQLRRDKAHAAELEAIRAEIGAMNGRQPGVHGGTPAEHQEPVAARPQGGSAAPATFVEGGGGNVGTSAEGNGANPTPSGENK